MDLADFFAGLDSNDNFHDARVDPFEPSRVWITSTPVIKVVGPLTSFGATVRTGRERRSSRWSGGRACCRQGVVD